MLYTIAKKRSHFNTYTGISTKANSTSHISFAFNPFNLSTNSSEFGKLVLFAQPVHNFYLEEPMAQASTTMAACSLFLDQETNFNNEI